MNQASSIENASNHTLENAYTTVLPELDAMGSEELLAVNLEIVTAVTTTHGVFPELLALRPRIAKLPEFDLAKFDRLRLYASAAAYAQTLHMVAVTPPDDFRELSEEGMKLRELLFAEAGSLVLRGLIAENALRDVRRGNGFRVLVTDLQLLVNVFNASWTKIEGKSATSREELDRAGILVSKLIDVLGRREQGPAEIARTALYRDRAFTLFIRTYDQARRAVSYLRWGEGDVDEIIPSLYRGRRGKRRAEVESEPEVTLPGLGTVAVAGATPKPATTLALTDASASALLAAEGPFVQ